MKTSTKKLLLEKGVSIFKSLEEFIKSLNEDEIIIKIGTSITSYGSTI